MDIAIGILAVFRGGRWRFLIARQHEQKACDGYWELPGDRVLDGETPVQSLKREFVEELALDINVGQSLAMIEISPPPDAVRLYPFYCTLVDQTAEAKNLKMAEHHWITIDEIDDYKYPLANEKLIKDLGDLLS